MWTSSNEIEEIHDLLEFFSKNTYNAWEHNTHPKVHHVMQKCLDLFGLDYTYSVISNSNGELSSNYPSSLVILERDKNHEEISTTPINGHLHSLNLSTPNGDSQHISTSTYDGFNQDLPKIKDLCSKARYARCRARFPIPVILFNKKHICRSATLSGGPEIYGRASFDYFFSGNSGGAATTATTGTIDNNKAPDSETAAAAAAAVEEDLIVPDVEGQGDWQLFDRVRNQDIRLLKSFQVQTIVDLMVEKKKVKFGVYVTSSEKVDKKNRYAEFKLISLPYPGCEFFKQYRDNGYSGEELMFEWNQGHVDANIYVPSDDTTESLKLEWNLYKKWDLVQLTQNYMKLLLAYLKGDNSGMLIHCISGWDRTPLFVSLLRLSLWADGAIHKSLSSEQILYLTLAYDWLLFGHNLEDRLSKGEEILYFCFYFLTHMVDVEFSIDYNIPYCQATTASSQPENNIPLHGGSYSDENDRENHANIEDSCQNGVNSLNGVLPDHHVDEHTPLSVISSVVVHDDCNGAQYHNVNGLSNHSDAHFQNHQLEMNELNASDSKDSQSKIKCNGEMAHDQNGTTSDHPLLDGGLDCLQLSESNCTVVIKESTPSLDLKSCPIVNGSVEESQPKVVLITPEPITNGKGVGTEETETSLNSSTRDEDGETIKSTHVSDVNSRPTTVMNGVMGEEELKPNLSEFNSDSVIKVNGYHELSTVEPLPLPSELATKSGDDNDQVVEKEESPISKVNTAVNGDVPTTEDSKHFDEESKDKNVILPLSINEMKNSLPGSTILTTSTENGGVNGSSPDTTPIPILITKRSERLQLVRSHFYSIYSAATQSNGVNENTSGSGLSVIIDNIATKVGIRAPNRSTS